MGGVDLPKLLTVTLRFHDARHVDQARLLPIVRAIDGLHSALFLLDLSLEVDFTACLLHIKWVLVFHSAHQRVHSGVMSVHISNICRLLALMVRVDVLACGDWLNDASNRCHAVISGQLALVDGVRGGLESLLTRATSLAIQVQ